ncbi:ElaA protein [Mariniplasma anaerobium]|uniref:ElaA protein n=2 Tax=Mariniplasma anaerobium TaxID=2735436 RepID=A0A7U9TI43_9MOLU|nr:ElaA protein [Mariniplasma anaerobium]
MVRLICLNMSLKKIYKKKFNQLTNQEIYDMLDLRYTVFLMEQKIFYVDTDYKDQDSMHYFIKNDEDKIISYLRVLPKGLKYEEYSVGRVVTDFNYRKKGLATLLMETVKKDLIGNPIRISGQAYLKDYYENLGFKTVLGPYIEEGIQHYEMLCSNEA